jgi:hypothetical protein
MSRSPGTLNLISVTNSLLSLLVATLQLLGINIFSYVLGAAIIVFLSLNYVLGPGWLGSAIGMQGAGSFDEVSDSLPSTIDLSDPSFRL